MTEVLYWTVVEIKPPVLDQLELFFLEPITFLRVYFCFFCCVWIFC